MLKRNQYYHFTVTMDGLETTLGVCKVVSVEGATADVDFGDGRLITYNASHPTFIKAEPAGGPDDDSGLRGLLVGATA